MVLSRTTSQRHYVFGIADIPDQQFARATRRVAQTADAILVACRQGCGFMGGSRPSCHRHGLARSRLLGFSSLALDDEFYIDGAFLVDDSMDAESAPPLQ